ncbi:MAG: hypothetical protein PHC71_06340 [Candidatus Omnitrophica bacterium]|nr:hypothetical protein [Candidatus Omnitrophota bacterium]
MRKLLVFLMLLLMAGCASVSVQKYFKEGKYPETNPASIVVFPQKPSRTFIELGEITVRGANDWGQIEKIFRSKAAEMGADAAYVFSKQEETRQYVSPDDCYVYGGYYYPYQHFGWNHYHHRYHYPRGYYYCYGYQSTVETATFITAVGIAIKYTSSAKTGNDI